MRRWPRPTPDAPTDGATLFREGEGGDTDDLASGEVLGHDRLGPLVFRPAVDRHQHDAVGHEVVGIRRVGEGSARPLEEKVVGGVHRDHLGCRHGHQLERPPARVRGLLQLLAVAHQVGHSGVALVVGPAVEHGAFGREARGDVHVPVGAVSEALAHFRCCARQPDEVAHAQMLAQHLLGHLLAHVGIAVGIEDRAPGGHERTGAVHLDGAAFRDEGRLEEREVQQSCGLAGYLRVAGVRPAPAPPVEAPARDGDASDLVHHEDRPVVPRPDVVQRHCVERHVLGADAKGAQLGFEPVARAGILHDDANLDVRLHGAGHGQPGGLELHVVAGTGAHVLGGPLEPHGGVRLPLGGHAEVLRL